MKPDCCKCGVCCISFQEQDVYCDVTAEDVQRLPLRFVHKNVRFTSTFDMLVFAPQPLAAIATVWKKQCTGPAKGYELCVCAALRGSIMKQVNCAVYDKRPDVCRGAIKPGDRNCREVRKRFATILKEIANDRSPGR